MAPTSTPAKACAWLRAALVVLLFAAASAGALVSGPPTGGLAATSTKQTMTVQYQRDNAEVFGWYIYAPTDQDVIQFKVTSATGIANNLKILDVGVSPPTLLAAPPALDTVYTAASSKLFVFLWQYDAATSFVAEYNSIAKAGSTASATITSSSSVTGTFTSSVHTATASISATPSSREVAIKPYAAKTMKAWCVLDRELTRQPGYSFALLITSCTRF
eukprot:tig00000246_g21521.t1